MVNIECLVGLGFATNHFVLEKKTESAPHPLFRWHFRVHSQQCCNEWPVVTKWQMDIFMTFMTGWFLFYFIIIKKTRLGDRLKTYLYLLLFLFLFLFSFLFLTLSICKYAYWAFMMAICFWEATFRYRLYISCKNHTGKALNYQTWAPIG